MMIITTHLLAAGREVQGAGVGKMLSLLCSPPFIMKLVYKVMEMILMGIAPETNRFPGVIKSLKLSIYVSYSGQHSHMVQTSSLLVRLIIITTDNRFF